MISYQNIPEAFFFFFENHNKYVILLNIKLKNNVNCFLNRNFFDKFSKVNTHVIFEREKEKKQLVFTGVRLTVCLLNSPEHF